MNGHTAAPLGCEAARPKLLYLAYHFRPALAIASIRTWNTAVHLTRLGWQVSVVTPDPSLWKNPDCPERVEYEIKVAGFQRILTGHGWRVLVPGEVRGPQGRVAWFLGGICRRAARLWRIESQVGWLPSVRRACAHLQPADVDVILATAKPNITFRAGRWLHERLHRPLVFDYRDPWTGDPHVSASIPRWQTAEESRLIKACAAVTVVSPSWATMIGRTFGVSDRMHVISNGFDPEMSARVTPKVFGHFAVVYAGTLYPPKRILDPVLHAFRQFAAARPEGEPRFHYYGSHGPAVRDAAQRIGVGERVVVHGTVAREEALGALKGADVTVVVASIEEQGTLSDNGMVTAKIFDCLAVGRPMLVVAPRGSDVRQVVATAGGGQCFTASEVEGMADMLARVARGEVPEWHDPGAYHWAHIGRQLDAVLRSVLAEARARQ